MSVNIHVGKGKKNIELIDTTGLTDRIHQDENIRKAISQTLASIRESQIILHMVDASTVFSKGAVSSLGEVDYQVAQFAQLKNGYVMLANKIDLNEGCLGLNKLKQEFPGNKIIPVSAKHKTGFKEVLSFVRKNI
jgi:predicted GTPase